ncbi:MAG: 2-oxo acid dehydrogenase subunit E2, partial [Solirubrobacteraceae bacterium]
LYAAEGETIAVGAPLAEIAVSQNGSSGSSGNGAPPAAEAPAEPGGEAEIIDIVTPGGSESVTEGTILEWPVKVGDSVKDGDTIVEISTDKVDMELPAPADGTITEILFEEGATVGVGEVIARMSVGAAASAGDPAAGEVGGSQSAPGTAAPGGSQSAPGTAAPSNGAPESGVASGGGGSPSGPGASFATAATPVAQRAASALGVNLQGVSGSARGGRVTKDDVLYAAANVAELPAGATKIKGGGAALARYMEQSRQIPTATSFRTLAVSALDERRKQLKSAGQRVSFTHLIAYAIARAATDDMPVMAHHFAQSNGDPYRVDDGQVNLGLAVDVEKKDGSRTLMVPVIRDAGRLDFRQFLDAYNALVEKARTNTLSADDLTGGNVSLTNPGGIGTVASVPRLMVDQGTIVATGSISYPVGLEAIGAQIGAEKVMTMTSTYDHRVIQGAESGRFLKVVEEYLQGEHGFYETVFSALGASLPPLPARPAAGVGGGTQSAAAAVGTGGGTQSPDAAGPAGPAAASAPSEALLQAVQASTSVLKAYRMHGHLAAELDPLHRAPGGDPALDPANVGLTPELMAQIPARILRMYVPGATLAEAIPYLKETYCGPIAYEMEHIGDHEQRVWLRKAIESSRFRTPLTPDEQRRLYARLCEVEGMERYLRRSFLGQKQFSLEGLDVLIPLLDESLELAAAGGARQVVLGMAHRGRLNVLAHTVGMPYEQILREFEGERTIDVVTADAEGGTGDVKYHLGAEGVRRTAKGPITVTIAANPSHLEAVDPVVEGMTRAAQTDRMSRDGAQDPTIAVPILLHGDAAFAGQGIVAETFNLYALEGYSTGGTLHVITNNQVGFTTDPAQGRSTRHSSDLAKGYDTPIIHVNADDPEAAVASVRLALAYRARFHHDVVIDLVGYRRFGHNEQDEPAYTQPIMAIQIDNHPTVRELYG